MKSRAVRFGRWYVHVTRTTRGVVHGVEWFRPTSFTRYRAAPGTNSWMRVATGESIFTGRSWSSSSSKSWSSPERRSWSVARQNLLVTKRGELGGGGWREKRPPFAVVEELENHLRRCVRHADCVAHNDLATECWRARNRYPRRDARRLRRRA